MKYTPKITEARVQVFSDALVRGESQSDAYREMHPACLKWKPETIHNKASQWANSSEVQAKVAELRSDAAKRNETTVDLIDKMHKRAYQIALKNKNPSAMTSCAKNLGDLHGLNQNKSKLVTDDGEGGDAPIREVTVSNHFHSPNGKD